MEENWKDIKGYEHYMVSSMGRVKSFAHCNQGRILKVSKDKDGYLISTLSLNSIPKMFKVHRLVAMAFLDNPENKPTVNHINGIKDDNRLENLEWATQSENRLHAFATGLQKSSDKHKEAISKVYLTRKVNLSGRLVLNTVTGIYYISIKEAQESMSKRYGNAYLCRILAGYRKNDTNFIYV